jgi:hypothetical protein
MLDINGCYKRDDDIVIKSLGGKKWALNMKTGGEYTLNDTAYDVLNVLSEPGTIDDVVDAIVRIYDVPKETFANDCKVWLQSALEKGLVEKA